MSTQTLFAHRALTAAAETSWRRNVVVEIDAEGSILSVAPDSEKPSTSTEVDILLPALSNLHSHSFQRLLAGLVEKRADDAADDNFWTWRQAMYRAVPQLGPDEIEVVAAQVQMEMLEAGYAAMAEFHYIHHDVSGAAYDDPALLSRRVMAAAKHSGVGLTHLPVLYMRGGVNNEALSPAQLRFGCDAAAFAAIYEAAASELVRCPGDFRLGVAPHSLRAVSPAGLEFVTKLGGDNPIHIHIAEQTAEVEAVLAAYGARPVEWLLDNCVVDRRWCLVHATHMSPAETAAFAASGAVAGVCPLTEANLGDGVFDGVNFMRAGGAFGVGSDCNFRISLSEELRAFEYSQRLRDRARMALAGAGHSVGRALYEGAAKGGAQALGREAGELSPGRLADLVALDADNDILSGLDDDRIFDAWIFAGDDRLVCDVWSAGRHVVKGGRHIRRDEISGAFRAVAARVRSGL